jgi:hypothetical protein
VRPPPLPPRVRAAPLGSALPGVRVGAEAVASREPASVAPVAGPDPLTDAGAPDAVPTGGAR